MTAGIPAVIEEVTPSGSVYYVREPNGALIARVAGEDVSYYHFDALGSTRLLTNADGAVTDTYTYDAWGNLTGHTGTTNQPYQYVGQLGYYTHTQDENMDLLQLGVRFYDPQTGRFTQRDPAGDSLNLYEYVAGNPVVYTDPSGLKRGINPGTHKRCACVYEVWSWYRAHRDDWFSGKDKAAHCWFTCKMVKYCNISPMATALTGAAKECYDCIDRDNPGTRGWEDVEWQDFRADLDGIWIALQPNSDCYRDCMGIWKSGRRGAPSPPTQPPKMPLPRLPSLPGMPPIIYS